MCSEKKQQQAKKSAAGCAGLMVTILFISLLYNLTCSKKEESVEIREERTIEKLAEENPTAVDPMEVWVGKWKLETGEMGFIFNWGGAVDLWGRDLTYNIENVGEFLATEDGRFWLKIDYPGLISMASSGAWYTSKDKTVLRLYPDKGDRLVLKKVFYDKKDEIVDGPSTQAEKPKQIRTAPSIATTKHDEKSHTIKTSKPTKLIDWTLTPEEQGIKVGDWIRVKGYSAQRPSGWMFTIDSKPRAPWTRTRDIDEIANVVAGFTDEELRRNDDINVYNAVLDRLVQQGKGELGYHINIEVKGQIFDIGTTTRRYTSGLPAAELYTIQLKQNSCTFKILDDE